MPDGGVMEAIRAFMQDYVLPRGGLREFTPEENAKRGTSRIIAGRGPDFPVNEVDRHDEFFARNPDFFTLMFNVLNSDPLSVFKEKLRGDYIDLLKSEDPEFRHPHERLRNRDTINNPPMKGLPRKGKK